MPDLVAMVAPFAEEETLHFQGRGGKEMTYIEDETVMDRLDLGFGRGNWSIHVEPIPVYDGVVKVTLAVRVDDGPWVEYQDFGYPNREGGESLKEAVSDGIRRCGRYLGIARDLYRKDSPPVVRTHAAPQRVPMDSIPRLTPVAPRTFDKALVYAIPNIAEEVARGEAARPAVARSSTAVPEPPLDWDVLDKSKPEPFGTQAAVVRDVDGTMTTKELLDRADSGQVPVDALAQASKKLYGPKAWQIKALTDVQRYTVAVEVGLA